MIFFVFKAQANSLSLLKSGDAVTTSSSGSTLTGGKISLDSTSRRNRRLAESLDSITNGLQDVTGDVTVLQET